MRLVRVTAASAAAIFAVLSVSAVAQEPPTPAPPSDQLPPVDVNQKQATPAPVAKKKSAAKKNAAPVSPAAQPPPAVAATPQLNPETINPNSVYGSPASTGAAERAYESAITPVNPQQLIPTRSEEHTSELQSQS